MCSGFDLIRQTMSDSNCRQVPGSDPQARKNEKATKDVRPLWLGIRRCLSSLAAARDKAQQTQTGQQHGIGFGFGDRAANGGDLPMVIDPRRVG